MILADGTILPSHQNVVDTVRLGPMTEQFGNWGLRVGQVRKIIRPDDKRSVSKKFNEYQVEVVYRDRLGRTTLTVYPNCFLASALGGRGDKTFFTPRFSPKTTQAGVGEGSKVIIGHLNGDRHQAVILAGIRDQDDEPDKDLGHNLFWEFNGIRALINKDGEFSLEFNGATNYDGTLIDGADADASGTFLKFKKDGNLALVHGTEFLELDRAGKSWNWEADQNITVTTKTGNIQITAEGDIGIFGHGQVSDMRLGVKFGRISLESNTGVAIGADAELATDHLVKGDTWQMAEQQMLTKLMTYLGAAGGALTTAGVSLLVPVTGAAAAAPQVTLAAQALIQAVAALGTYMSLMPTFLSKKNTTD